MKIYVGTIHNGEHDVHCFDGRTRYRLNPRYDLRNHSPDGFCWGYAGSGPAQLALALVADHAGDAIAQKVYQDFKSIVIARLNGDVGFSLTSDDIQRVLDAIDATLLPP